MNFLFTTAGIGARLDTALTSIQAILTGLVVTVGIIVAMFIIVSGMHKLKNPHEKDELFRAVGRVAGAVALGAALVWILPWVYQLFT